jgi:glycosyltransferase involved in cell wall biosynthesis
MKILFYNDFSKQIGGTEVYQSRLSAALRGAGHQVKEVFATEKEYPQWELGFKLWCLWGSLLPSPQVKARIKAQILAFGPEVIHVNNNKIYISMVYEIARELGIPVLTAFHDFHLLKTAETVFWKGLWKERNLKIVKNGTVVFLSLTHLIADCLQKNGCSPVRYLPLFVNRKEWYPGERKRQGKTVVYFGRIERAKGVFLLLQAFKVLLDKHWDLHLVFVGSGTHAKALEKEIQSMGISNRVKMLGRLPQQKLLDILQPARMAVVPTLTEEPFGMTGIEAQASGVPVVAARVGGIPEWCLHEQTGLLFEGGNALDLAEKMENLLKDPTLSERLIQGALQRIEQIFQENAVVNKTLDLYREMQT